MRFIRFVRSFVLTALLTTALVVGTTAPALAVSPVPQKAPLFNGSVYAIAHRGSTIYVGGSFTRLTWGGTTYPRNRLAALDAVSGRVLSWAPSANGLVRALAVDRTSVYAGGDFSTVSGHRRDNLARLDATSGRVDALAHTVTGAPYALATGNGRLYAAGSFSAIDGTPRRNLAAFSLATGRLDPTWHPAADAAVHAVVVHGSRVFAGGAFHRVGGVAMLRLAGLDATTGSVTGTFRPQPPARVNAITVDPTGQVYAATGGTGGRALAYGAGGTLRWQRAFDGDASAIAALDNTIYVGGHFDRACTTTGINPRGACVGGAIPRVKLAAFSPTGTLTAWSPQANGVIGVRALTADPARHTLSAVGDFTRVAGHTHKRYALFG
ncbi:hypothetical protein GCM10010435_90140 [Winogradskya consettensis]|uniref:Pyrroloquinoline-quinone binding quinoprotein n=1 Tax=Winogradskya consettensis TaxID=113560 RepID=A0A919SSM0_9ACTN|nr:PQQ-like beta-propeller repeat protein [Actinoplanes consettensis]GIM77782.1 hypothetical protein Aco04nite_57050 [Actinoplanes consettensis]